MNEGQPDGQPVNESVEKPCLERSIFSKRVIFENDLFGVHDS